MKFTDKVLPTEQNPITRYQPWIVAGLVLMVAACTSQQAYEGLKSGHRSGCLEYPESEYQECIDDSETSYHDYLHQRDEIIGD